MKVMIALDESEGSLYALNWALTNILKPPVTVTEAKTEELAEADNSKKTEELAEADNSNNSTVVYLVHVSAPFNNFIYSAGPVVYTTPSVVDSVKHAQEQISAAIFSRALQTCEQNKVKAQTLAFRGDPKEMIVQAAEQMQVNLLVVGNRGLGMLKRAFLGSVSDYCTHHAHCPVLIVKPPKKSAINEAQLDQRKAA